MCVKSTGGLSAWLPGRAIGWLAVVLRIFRCVTQVIYLLTIFSFSWPNENFSNSHPIATTAFSPLRSPWWLDGLMTESVQLHNILRTLVMVVMVVTVTMAAFCNCDFMAKKFGVLLPIKFCRHFHYCFHTRRALDALVNGWSPHSSTVVQDSVQCGVWPFLCGSKLLWYTIFLLDFIAFINEIRNFFFIVASYPWFGEIFSVLFMPK